jgi:hypothetical protein
MVDGFENLMVLTSASLGVVVELLAIFSPRRAYDAIFFHLISKRPLGVYSLPLA